MSKITTMTVFFSVLLCCSALCSAAGLRGPTLRDEGVAEQQLKAEEKGVEVEESCDGIGEEECLRRKTIAAHLDYIYTQRLNP
ncbi:hypothetical protein C2S52_021348 [Perilla frutescens var. hirtella]|nr:hypothetical protein C2S52_021348 [Perilla frutescens var. hirtella]